MRIKTISGVTLALVSSLLTLSACSATQKQEVATLDIVEQSQSESYLQTQSGESQQSAASVDENDSCMALDNKSLAENVINEFEEMQAAAPSLMSESANAAYDKIITPKFGGDLSVMKMIRVLALGGMLDECSLEESGSYGDTVSFNLISDEDQVLASGILTVLPNQSMKLTDFTVTSAGDDWEMAHQSIWESWPT